MREPVARTISAYQYLTETGKKPGDYLDFLVGERNRQVRRLCEKPDLDAAFAVLRDKMGFVGLTEKFDESLIIWKRWVGDPSLEIRYERINVSSDRTLKREIESNEEFMEKTKEATRLDQALYQRVVEELYPAQQSAYGASLESDVEAFQQSLVGFRTQHGKSRLGDAKRNLLFRPCWQLATKRGL